MIDKTKDGRGQAQIAQSLDKSSNYERGGVNMSDSNFQAVDSSGLSIRDREDYRLFHDANKPIGAPLVELAGLSSFSHADTEGFITLEDGTKLSYDYLIDNIEDIREVHERNTMSTSKENEGKRRLEEGKGKTEDEALYNHVSENISPYFMLGPSGQEDINIVKINEAIEELSLIHI